MSEKPELGLRYSSVGVSGVGPMGEGETLRVVIAEQELNSGEAGLDDLRRALEIDIAPWSDRVQLVDAVYEGLWELPVLGEVPAPAAVLIRPDGHTAWVGEGTAAGLAEALATWFGAPSSNGQGTPNGPVKPAPASWHCSPASPRRDREADCATGSPEAEG